MEQLTTTPHMALCLESFTATGKYQIGGNVKKSQRLHGMWMPDDNFYFPMSQADGGVVVCVSRSPQVERIIEDVSELSGI